MTPQKEATPGQAPISVCFQRRGDKGILQRTAGGRTKVFEIRNFGGGAGGWGLREMGATTQDAHSGTLLFGTLLQAALFAIFPRPDETPVKRPDRLKST